MPPPRLPPAPPPPHGGGGAGGDGVWVSVRTWGKRPVLFTAQGTKSHSAEGVLHARILDSK